jgi:hypothetical protein
MPTLSVVKRRSPTQFIVEIHYREPGYEARHGARDEPFRFRYRIDAGNAESARWLALDEFRRIAELSSVGWVRDVVGVDVIPVIRAE